MKKRILLIFIILTVLHSAALSLSYGVLLSRHLGKIHDHDKEVLTEQLESRLELLDALIPLMEAPAREFAEGELRRIYRRLTKLEPNPEAWDEALLHDQVENESFLELYWIDESNIIQATTFPADQGLDLGAISPSFSQFLEEVRQSDEIVTPHFSFSNMTGKLMMYSYFSPPGGNSILELSLELEKFLATLDPGLNQPFNPRMLFTSLLEENRYLVGIDFISFTNIASWSMITGEPVDRPPEVTLETLREEGEILLQEGPYQVSYQYIEHLSDPREFSDHYCLKAVYDMGYYQALTGRSFALGGLMTLISLALATALLGFLVDRFLVGYVLSLHKALMDSMGGNYTIRLPLNPVLREYREISLAFNDLMGSAAERETALKEQRKNLRLSLQDREALMREVHHRVKNNLQIISSLVSIEQDKMDGPGKKVLYEIGGRVGAMSAVHELLYDTGNHSEVDLKSLVAMVVESVAGIYYEKQVNVSLETRALQGCVPLEGAVPLALILSEGVINGITHGAAPGDSLVFTVSLKRGSRDSGWILVFQDNGKGFPGEGRLEEGFGFTLMRNLAHQLQGEWVYYNEAGAAWELRLPESLLINPSSGSAYVP